MRTITGPDFLIYLVSWKVDLSARCNIESIPLPIGCARVNNEFAKTN